MSNISFEADPLSWKVTRFFLVLQIAGLALVVALCLLNAYFLALTISLLTLFAFIALVFWLYSRYRELPLVREKRELERLLVKFQKGIESETNHIQSASRQREGLFEAERDEIQNALQTLQRDHMDNGLAAAQVQEATIAGIGPKLKERLAAHGVTSAAHVSEQIAQFSGVGEAKHRALMNWRASVLARLESTRPHALSHGQLQTIQQKYQVLRDQTEAAERQARASKQILEHELISFQPRIQHLAPLTFRNYLSRSLAARGVAAGLLAILLLVTQIVSSVSALTSTAVSMFAATPSASATLLPTGTLPPTSTATLPEVTPATLTPTRMSSPTAAPNTATVTMQTVQTNTALFTATLPATLPLPPTATPYIPISGNCDPSYPGVCIPPAPPDLDCSEMPYRDFQVLPSDPHHFDRDADGLGCES
jgi:hypothetical protein